MVLQTTFCNYVADWSLCITRIMSKDLEAKDSSRPFGCSSLGGPKPFQLNASKIHTKLSAACF